MKQDLRRATRTRIACMGELPRNSTSAAPERSGYEVAEPRARRAQTCRIRLSPGRRARAPSLPLGSWPPRPGRALPLPGAEPWPRRPPRRSPSRQGPGRPSARPGLRPLAATLPCRSPTRASRPPPTPPPRILLSPGTAWTSRPGSSLSHSSFACFLSPLLVLFLFLLLSLSLALSLALPFLWGSPTPWPGERAGNLRRRKRQRRGPGHGGEAFARNPTKPRLNSKFKDRRLGASSGGKLTTGYFARLLVLCFQSSAPWT
jgi:hypothetical protein